MIVATSISFSILVVLAKVAVAVINRTIIAIIAVMAIIAVITALAVMVITV